MIHACPSCGKKNRIPAARLDSTSRCGQCKEQLSPLRVPLHVHSEAEFTELVEGSPLPLLVDFWADWCGPCKAIAPELVKLAGSHAGRVVVSKVDTEALPGLSARFGIQGIPTLVLFRDGREAHRVSGAMNAQAIRDSFGL